MIMKNKMRRAQAARAFALVFGAIRAARHLHAALLDKLVRLPVSVFDTQPTGRILARLSRDTEAGAS